MQGDIYQETLEVHAGAEFEGKVTRLPAAKPSQVKPSLAKPAAAAVPQVPNGHDQARKTEADLQPVS